jgi:hypothetical protein
MSYHEKINEAIHEAHIITLNNTPLQDLLALQTEFPGLAYLCEDGKITDTIME